MPRAGRQFLALVTSVPFRCTTLLPCDLAGQEPAPAKKATAPSGDTTVASSAEYDGWKVYHSYSDRCHGQDATGSTFAPDLRHSVGANGMTEASFTALVLDGHADKGMPAFKAIKRLS